MAPENECLEEEFLLGMAYVQGLCNAFLDGCVLKKLMAFIVLSRLCPLEFTLARILASQPHEDAVI